MGYKCVQQPLRSEKNPPKELAAGFVALLVVPLLVAALCWLNPSVHVEQPRAFGVTTPGLLVYGAHAFDQRIQFDPAGPLLANQTSSYYYINPSLALTDKGVCLL